MISHKLILELQQIMKEEFNQELTIKESESLGNWVMRLIEIIIKNKTKNL